MINRSLPNLQKLLSQQFISESDMVFLLKMHDVERDSATPLLIACLSGNLSICRYLKQLGADVNAKTFRCKTIALQLETRE
jgi:hypothetical protein